MFSGSRRNENRWGENYVAQFRKDTDKNIERTNNSISRKKKELETETNQRKIDKLNKQISNLNSNLNQFNAAKTEIKALEESDVVYNIRVNQSDVPENAEGVTRYNITDKSVDIHLKEGYNAGFLSHEMKHGYQFEILELSFNSEGKAGLLHDLQDENEGFERGVAYGDNRTLAQTMRSQEITLDLQRKT